MISVLRGQQNNVVLFLFQREQFLQYSHYIRMKPELDSPLVSQAADFFKVTFIMLPPSSSILSSLKYQLAFDYRGAHATHT